MAKYIVPKRYEDGDQITILDEEGKVIKECTFVKIDNSFNTLCSKCCCKEYKFCVYVNCYGGYFKETNK